MMDAFTSATSVTTSVANELKQKPPAEADGSKVLQGSKTQTRVTHRDQRASAPDRHEGQRINIENELRLNMTLV